MGFKFMVSLVSRLMLLPLYHFTDKQCNFKTVRVTMVIKNELPKNTPLAEAKLKKNNNNFT